ncbi:uncharacterized protein [Watersipora subatra]|uniref:uncharacterized protein n=1 Tax=Watersipora subatra TaxID=2589382 RepID=UPI00355C05E7
MWINILSIGLLTTILFFRLTTGESRGKRTEIEFSSDADVTRYLANKGKDMEVLRCKKVVMIQWLHSVLPYVDLQCEVLGETKEVSWYYNDTLLDTGVAGSRFMSLSQPHYRKRTFYDTWFDYKLRLLHVTEEDNGPYTVALTSATGRIEHGDIMLEVMTDYREKKWTTWMNKIESDREARKNKKRSAAKLAKRREKELKRQIRKRAKSRKGSRNRRPEIFEGQ